MLKKTLKKLSLIFLTSVFSTLLICSSVNSAFSQNQGIINNLYPEDILANYSNQQQQDSSYFEKTLLDGAGTKNDGNLVRFGFKVGMNLSNMNFNKGYSGTSDPLESAWKTGFNFGLKIEIPLLEKVLLSQEYLFSRVRGEFEPFGTSYTVDYISFPILLKYSFSPKLSFVAGPQLELLIEGKEYIESNSSIVTKMIEQRNVGLTVGMAFLLTEDFGVNARFMHGYNHVGINQQNGHREFVYELIQFTADYLF